MSLTQRAVNGVRQQNETRLLERLVPALVAALLGLTLVFAVGFAQTDIVHNATHDERHGAGFPCH